MNEARPLKAADVNLSRGGANMGAARRGATPVGATSGDRRAQEVSFRLVRP